MYSTSKYKNDESMNIRIVLAEKQILLRQGLKALIQHAPGLEVVGEAGDGRKAVTVVGETNPRVVLMDVAMSRLNGIEATRLIKKQHPGTGVLALTEYHEKRYVYRMLEAGVSGYLLKNTSFQALEQAIRRVAEGGYYFNHDISSLVIQKFIEHASDEEVSGTATLSNREREVLQLVAEGRTTKEIAAELGVTRKTVETHRQTIMNKLDIHNVAALTRFALQEGVAFL